MQVRSLIFLLVALATAVVGAVWLFGGSGDRAGTEAPAAYEATAATDRSGRIAELATSPDTAPKRASADAGRSDPDAANGTGGSISAGSRVGRVVDRSARPVPGARVVSALAPGLPLDHARRDGSLPTGWVEAVTDADGRFELALPRGGRLRLGVMAAGFAPFATEDHPPRSVGGAELDDVVLVPGAILEGEVRDANGAAVPGAVLRPVADRLDRQLELTGFAPVPLAESDASGAFRVDVLPVGPWFLAVHAEGFPVRTFEGTTDRAGLHGTHLVFELARGETIAGRVVDAPAFELPRLQVRAEWLGESGGPGGAAPREGQPLDAGAPAAVASVDGDGRFALQGLEPAGEYQLRLYEAPGAQSTATAVGLRARSQAVAARAGDGEVVLRYTSGSGLSFRVVDASNGAPLRRFEVTYGDRDPEQALTDGTGAPVLDHPDGRVFIDDLGLRTGSRVLGLTVRAEGYRDRRVREIALSPGAELYLGEIELEPVPVLSVTVLTVDERVPVAGASVSLAPADASPTAAAERRLRHAVLAEWPEMAEIPGLTDLVLTDAAGVARLNGFPGETCVLRVESRRHAVVEIVDLEFPADASVVEREVLVSQGGTVIVTVLDAAGDPGAGVRVERRAPAERDGIRLPLPPGVGPDRRTDADGTVAFERLEDGVHGFRIAPPDVVEASLEMGGGALEAPGAGDWTEVLVRGGETVRVTVVEAPQGAIDGVVIEGTGPLAGANLALVAVDADAAGEAFGPALGAAGGLGGLGGGADRWAPKSRTDGEGRFRFDDVEVGDYVLRVSHSGRAMVEEFEVSVGIGENAVTLELSSAVLTGVVTDMEGRPLAGMHVAARTADGDLSRSASWSYVALRGPSGLEREIRRVSSGGTARTAADGTFRLVGIAAGEPVVLVAWGGSFLTGRSEPVTVGGSEARDGVELALEPGGDLEVRAFDADGSEARGCIVEAWRPHEGGFVSEVGYIAVGSTVLRGLSPGPWSVRVMREGLSGPDPDPREEVSIEAGGTAVVVLDLP